ncbi:MAG TPA: metallophosphoesterase family protein [Gaiellales bacterium]|nr:metallophosphoesterase family protein [Gaiellales bacterium]
MITLAHISDLHFGTEDGTLADRLVEELQALEPRLVIVSGDLTQRARRTQFRAARAYLDRLPPFMVVPGNHDIPLYDIGRRAASPMGRYRTMISEELDPFHLEDDLAVLGLNTTRPQRWKEGSISATQVALIREVFARAAPEAHRVLFTHHPFIPPPQFPRMIVVHGQAAALPVIRAARIEVLLAGHLHLGYAGMVEGGPGLLSVQAGTAISRRRRGQPNAYNVIRLGGEAVVVEPRVWDGERFAPAMPAAEAGPGAGPAS